MYKGGHIADKTQEKIARELGIDLSGSTNWNLSEIQFGQPKSSMESSTYYLDWHPLFKPMPLANVKRLK